MEQFTYNDLQFTTAQCGEAWDISRGSTLFASGVFKGASTFEAIKKTKELVQLIYPVGVRIVGPSVSRTLTIGDLKIVPPEVNRAIFTQWDKDSVTSGY